MWKLYLDFEAELQNTKIFDPMSEIFNAAGPFQPPPPGQACIVPPGTNVELDDTFAIIESERQSSRFVAKRRFVVAGNGPQFEPLVRSETLSQSWVHQQAPAPVPAKAKK